MASFNFSILLETPPDVLIANEENKIIGIKTLARFFEISYVSFVHPETQRNDMERNVEFTFLGMSTKDVSVR
jgi:hypothetical protein